MMFEEAYFHISTKFLRAALGLVILVGFIVGFWDELILIWELLVAFFLVLFFRTGVLPINAETFRAIFVVGWDVSFFVVGYLSTLAWISRFVLPAHTTADKKEVSKRLRAYNLPFGNLHGPAVFYKEGRPIAEKSELEESGQGVALLDMYSAVVLEQQEGNDEEDFAGSGKDRKMLGKPIRFSFVSHLKKILGFIEVEEDESMVRASGPGLVLIQDGEKITGGADLRKQFRRREGVLCNTGDGIEVSTSISVVFTIGESPEILKVSRINDDWNAVKIDAVTSDQNNTIDTRISDGRVKVILDKFELSEEDKLEIEKSLTEGGFTWAVGEYDISKSKSRDTFLFLFDEARVVDAVISRARDTKEGKLGEWTDLPVDVAVEIFRSRLVHTSYDDLYKPDEPDVYPMKEFKEKFVNDVKTTGILGYQIVRRKDGRPLENEQVCRNADLVFSPPKRFTNSAVLRDRGIKVLAAGFADLEPTNSIVRERFFDVWQARWQQEADKIRADHELQATRIRNRERARAQQDMIFSLSHILQANQYTSEALVMRLYQALEAAATQPTTQRLLPRDTIRMLWNLRQWLLPEEQTKGDSSPHAELVDGEETDLDE
jgi:hypothetical protein